MQVFGDYQARERATSVEGTRPNSAQKNYDSRSKGVNEAGVGGQGLGGRQDLSRVLENNSAAINQSSNSAQKRYVEARRASEYFDQDIDIGAEDDEEESEEDSIQDGGDGAASQIGGKKPTISSYKTPSSVTQNSTGNNPRVVMEPGQDLKEVLLGKTVQPVSFQKSRRDVAEPKFSTNKTQVKY